MAGNSGTPIAVAILEDSPAVFGVIDVLGVIDVSSLSLSSSSELLSLSSESVSSDSSDSSDSLGCGVKEFVCWFCKRVGVSEEAAELLLL